MGTLKNLVIAVTGTLEHDVTQLKKWIEANDGRYSPHVRRGITHLIAGKDAWKKATDAVQAANKLGVFVVNFDWLEDSLHKRRKLAEKQYTWENITQRKRREREIKKLGPRMTTKQFIEGCEQVKKTTGSGTSKSRVVVRKPRKSTSVLTADMHVPVPFVSAAEDLKRRREEREAAQAKKAEAAAGKKVEDGTNNCATSSTPSTTQSSTWSAENMSSASSHALGTTCVQPASPAPGVQAKKPALKDLYHYYLDTTGFEYKAILTRCNLRANEITRYQLSLLESHTKPHVYCTFIQYVPPGAGTTVSSGDDACIQALLDFDKTFHEGAAPGMETNAPVDDSKEVTTNVLAPPLPLPQQDTDAHPEAARLRSLLHPPPRASQAYKSLIAPMGSTFATAWLVFRHAFRDLTLLSWEERFDTSKTLYKTRAAHLTIEPFVYVRPKHGLPLGLRVQQQGLFQNQTLAPLATAPAHERTASEAVDQKPAHRHNNDAYTYNAFQLPGLNLSLGPGIIGQAVARDNKAARDAAAEAKKRADEAEEVKLKRPGAARNAETTKNPIYSRPLFNRVRGRPATDARGRCAGDGGRGGGLLGGGVVKQRKPLPREREEAR